MQERSTVNKQRRYQDYEAAVPNGLQVIAERLPRKFIMTPELR